MMPTTVSVVVPTRNRTTELIRAIDSVRTQSLPPKEIIVVDDSSESSVAELMTQRYGCEIRVITNANRIGASGSRNIGATQATGEYIAFLDSDDYWASTKLEKQIAILGRDRTIGLVYCDMWRIDQARVLRDPGKLMIREQLWENLLSGWTAPNTSTLVFRRSVFCSLGGFDSRLSSCQDHDIWMRIALSRVPVDYCPEKLSFFAEDGSRRISNDYRARLAGMDDFLSKWETKIVRIAGRRRFKQFEGEYTVKVAFPLLANALQNRESVWVIRLLVKRLAWQAKFYSRLAHAISRKMRR
jgi:glycosyltransferase involved in cell wall biosynthesis